MKLLSRQTSKLRNVASSREDAWIETLLKRDFGIDTNVASSREDAWIETSHACDKVVNLGRVLPRGRVD